MSAASSIHPCSSHCVFSASWLSFSYLVGSGIQSLSILRACLCFLKLRANSSFPFYFWDSQVSCDFQWVCMSMSMSTDVLVPACIRLGLLEAFRAGVWLQPLGTGHARTQPGLECAQIQPHSVWHRFRSLINPSETSSISWGQPSSQVFEVLE